MKKKYDLRINSKGQYEPMSYGFFEKVDSISFCKTNPEDYIIVELPKAIYRIHKRDYEKYTEKWLQKVKEHQSR